MRTRRVRAASLLILATLVAACDTGTEPDVDQDLDAQSALQDYEALDAALGSEELRVLGALGNRTPFGAASPVLDALSGARGDAGGRRWVLDLAERMLLTEAPARAVGAPIISDTHRGATFAYDAAAGEYAIDPTRTGAPANGVRFVLYQVDASEAPIVAQEIGYADLIDEGDGSAQDVVLRLNVVQHDVTVLDYRATVDLSLNRGAVTVRGFLVGGGVRLDFDIEVVATQNQARKTIDATFDIAVDARDFSITGTVRGVEEGTEGEGDIDVIVRHRDQSLRVDVRGSGGMIEGTVFLSGDVFATVSGSATAPTFLAADGGPIRFLELLVLHRVTDVMEDVFDFVEDLVDPVDNLVLLGIIL